MCTSKSRHRNPFRYFVFVSKLAMFGVFMSSGRTVQASEIAVATENQDQQSQKKKLFEIIDQWARDWAQEHHVDLKWVCHDGTRRKTRVSKRLKELAEQPMYSGILHHEFFLEFDGEPTHDASRKPRLFQKSTWTDNDANELLSKEVEISQSVTREFELTLSEHLLIGFDVKAKIGVALFGHVTAGMKTECNFTAGRKAKNSITETWKETLKPNLPPRSSTRTVLKITEERLQQNFILKDLISGSFIICFKRRGSRKSCLLPVPVVELFREKELEGYEVQHNKVLATMQGTAVGSRTCDTVIHFTTYPLFPNYNDLDGTQRMALIEEQSIHSLNQEQLNLSGPAHNTSPETVLVQEVNLFEVLGNTCLYRDVEDDTEETDEEDISVELYHA